MVSPMVLLRREPLPPLFMRFVMQTGFAYSRLVEQTVELLVRLVGKQVRGLSPKL